MIQIILRVENAIQLIKSDITYHTHTHTIPHTIHHMVSFDFILEFDRLFLESYLEN